MSGTFNAGVLGYGVRLTNFIINICAGNNTLSFQRDADDAIQNTLFQVGAIVLCTLVSIVRDQLTFFDGYFTLMVVHSPIAWYIYSYSPQLAALPIFVSYLDWSFALSVWWVEPGYSFTYGQSLSVVTATTSVYPVLKFLFELRKLKKEDLSCIFAHLISEFVFFFLGSGNWAKSINRKWFQNRLTLPPYEFEWSEEFLLPVTQPPPQIPPPATIPTTPEVEIPTTPSCNVVSTAEENTSGAPSVQAHAPSSHLVYYLFALLIIVSTTAG
ncbi:hypothetical protein B0H19DRAFT_1274930 [Mycena capillaripes]|nr:hypothetical protein B0H19DRAFT_1274930 [Mycena capillaripes]